MFEPYLFLVSLLITMSISKVFNSNGSSRLLMRNINSKNIPTITYQKRHLAFSTSTITAIGAMSILCTSAITAAGFMMLRYKVAKSNQFIVKTGFGIDNVTIEKKTIQWPFQTACVLNMAPTPYHLTIDKAKSVEMIEFKMPVAFTISPLSDKESLLKCVNTIGEMNSNQMKDLIFVAVAGACRRQAGNLLLSEIFSDRLKFRDDVIHIINEELRQFGMSILTMNIEELEDMEGNEYFKYMKKKALEGAVNKAKIDVAKHENNARIDVAEQQKMGDIGQKQHECETREMLAEIEKKAKLVENLRDIDVLKSNASRDVSNAENLRAVEVAQLEAKANSEKRKFDCKEKLKNLEIYKKFKD